MNDNRLFPLHDIPFLVRPIETAARRGYVRRVDAVEAAKYEIVAGPGTSALSHRSWVLTRAAAEAIAELTEKCESGSSFHPYAFVKH